MVPCPLHSQGLSRSHIPFTGSRYSLLGKQKFPCFMKSLQHWVPEVLICSLAHLFLVFEVGHRNYPPWPMSRLSPQGLSPESIKPRTWTRVIPTTAQCFLEIYLYSPMTSTFRNKTMKLCYEILRHSQGYVLSEFFLDDFFFPGLYILLTLFSSELPHMRCHIESTDTFLKSNQRGLHASIYKKEVRKKGGSGGSKMVEQLNTACFVP